MILLQLFNKFKYIYLYKKKRQIIYITLAILRIFATTLVAKVKWWNK